MLDVLEEICRPGAGQTLPAPLGGLPARGSKAALFVRPLPPPCVSLALVFKPRVRLWDVYLST